VTVLLDSIRRGLHGNGRKPTRHVVRIRVRGGYQPDTLHVEAGVPMRLIFRREETSSCSEQVIFPSFGKSVTLPPNELVTVDLPPAEPGEYEFTCAMGMLHGRLIVQRLAERDLHRTDRSTSSDLHDDRRLSACDTERSL
jgi:plastocyanin domain-containing protein